MPVQVSDMKMYKSSIITDTDINGSVMGTQEVLSGQRHNLFPRVTQTERTTGITRYRKEFLKNNNVDNDIAYDALIYLESKSNAGDHFAVASGTDTDTQLDVTTSDRIWVGCGSVATTLSGGETSIDILMESTDYAAPNGSLLHISSKYKVGVTVGPNVFPGDAVHYSGTQWDLTSPTGDYVYPNGVYLGDQVVFTIHSGTKEEWVQIAENRVVDEIIGTGDGTATMVSLTALDEIDNGVCAQEGKLPVISTTIGGTTQYVYIDASGNCSGYCSAGKLNMSDGTWDTPITWNAAPDNSANILATYCDLCYYYTGNVLTIDLDSTIANAYTANEAFASPCVYGGDIVYSVSDYQVVTGATLTYDDTTYPVIGSNKGTVAETYTLTFSSATAFNCTGTTSGAVGSGTVFSDFEVSDTQGNLMFRVRAAGWGGTGQAGDTFVFTTHPATFPHWVREVVPANTPPTPTNQVLLGWYAE